MKRKSIAGAVIKSLIFILVTVVTTTVLAISIANTGVSDTVSYNARFTDVTGLAVGDSVRIAGVQVGQVDSIGIVDRRVASVRFSVQRGRVLPATVTASVKYLNLVGERYVDLAQGAGPVNGTLAPGSTIPLDQTSPSLNLTALFDGFQPLFQGLSPTDVNQLSGEIIQVLQGEGGTVDDLVSNIASLTTTLAGKDKVIGEVIDNLSQVISTVNGDQQGFTDLISTLQQLIAGFSQDRQPIGEAITAISGLATSTASLLQEGRQPLKDSITQLGRLSSNLAANTPLLENFLQKTPQKLAAIGRIASYGSWLNMYLCQATVTGVTSATGTPPPTGVVNNVARCR